MSELFDAEITALPEFKPPREEFWIVAAYWQPREYWKIFGKRCFVSQELAKEYAEELPAGSCSQRIIRVVLE